MLQLPDRRLRLVFFGTPEIARTMLARLIAEKRDDVVLVVSQPDRPKGRGQKVDPTPVKAEAERHQIPVAQPEKLKDGVFAAQLTALQVDLAIVVAYGRILPKVLFEAPAFHTWNVHASLLPRHRGASPIQHAILAGDAETGVALMVLSEGLDEGPVLLEKKLTLTGKETGGGLTEQLAVLGAELLVDGLQRAKRDGLPITPQDPTRATLAPLLEKADGQLELSRSAAELDRRIRALTPWPGAALPGPGGPLKVLAAHPLPADHPAEPGTIVGLGNALVLATGDGWLALDTLQPAGKRSMAAADFLRGQGRNLRIGNHWSRVLES